MTKKIAISLPDELVDYARGAVRHGEAPSVSALIGEALNDRMRRQRLEDMLVEMLDETGGPLTDQERADIDRELDA